MTNCYHLIGDRDCRHGRCCILIGSLQQLRFVCVCVCDLRMQKRPFSNILLSPKNHPIFSSKAVDDCAVCSFPRLSNTIRLNVQSSFPDNTFFSTRPLSTCPALALISKTPPFHANSIITFSFLVHHKYRSIFLHPSLFAYQLGSSSDLPNIVVFFGLHTPTNFHISTQRSNLSSLLSNFSLILFPITFSCIFTSSLDIHISVYFSILNIPEQPALTLTHNYPLSPSKLQNTSQT